MSPQVAFQMVSMLRDVVDRGTGSPGARARRPRPGRRKDRHDRRLSRRLVRRLLVVGGRRRVGRLRSAGADRTRRVRRAVALPIWADFMKRSRDDAAAGRIRGARRARARRAVQRLVSAAGRGLSRSTRSTSRTATPCRPSAVRSTRARSPRQAQRVVGGLFRSLGSKIAGIFRRK